MNRDEGISIGTDPPGVCQKCNHSLKEKGRCQKCTVDRAISLGIWSMLGTGFLASVSFCAAFDPNSGPEWGDIGMVFYASISGVGLIVFLIFKGVKK